MLSFRLAAKSDTDFFGGSWLRPDSWVPKLAPEMPREQDSASSKSNAVGIRLAPVRSWVIGRFVQVIVYARKLEMVTESKNGRVGIIDSCFGLG